MCSWALTIVLWFARVVRMCDTTSFSYAKRTLPDDVSRLIALPSCLPFMLFVRHTMVLLSGVAQRFTMYCFVVFAFCHLVSEPETKRDRAVCPSSSPFRVRHCLGTS
jgi:hypothetical protein